MSVRDFSELLANNKVLEISKNASSKRHKEVTELFEERVTSLGLRSSFFCFCAGSIARGDCGSLSDLDLFIMSDGDVPKLDQIKLYSEIIGINSELEYPELSNDGEFLEVHTLDGISDDLGSKHDDYLNHFTTRMLFLLESKAVFNKELYDAHVVEVLRLYFKDKRQGEVFRPVYLINDILRYWRTLCLNYEVIRGSSKPWRKKNINLKFSRMLAVFSFLIPVVWRLVEEESDWIALVKMSPMERFSWALDSVGDLSLLGGFRNFVEAYSNFMELKERVDIDEHLAGPGVKKSIERQAQDFSNYIYMLLLSDEHSDPRLKRNVVI